MNEYRERFECYARAMEMVDHRYLRATCFNGLKEEIKAKLSLHSFNSLKELMTTAKMVDECNRIWTRDGLLGAMATQMETRMEDMERDLIEVQRQQAKEQQGCEFLSAKFTAMETNLGEVLQRLKDFGWNGVENHCTEKPLTRRMCVVMVCSRAIVGDTSSTVETQLRA